MNKNASSSALRQRQHDPGFRVERPDRFSGQGLQGDRIRPPDNTACTIASLAFAGGPRDGRLTGKKCQLIGEDAHAVAGRLLREAWLKRADKNDFNRAIRYADKGWR
jgi:hypothetical protein